MIIECTIDKSQRFVSQHFSVWKLLIKEEVLKLVRESHCKKNYRSLFWSNSVIQVLTPAGANLCAH